MHDAPVLARTLDPEPFPELYHDEEHRGRCHAHKCSRYEAVLIAEVGQPGCDAVTN